VDHTLSLHDALPIYEMRARLLLLVALALIGGLVLLGWRALEQSMAAPGPNSTAVDITVRAGSPLRAVLNDLAARGALRSARAVELYLRLHRRALHVQAGQYQIEPRATPAAILEQLSSGRVVLQSLTVVEGWTFADMRHALEAHATLVQTLRGKSDAEVMALLGHAGEAPEGRFFPDTYRFAAGTSDHDVLTLAYRQMQELLASAWAAKIADLPLRSAYEALTLASIVEKETARPDERPQIAGVFMARLRLGMRLQSDPTVIYGLGARYDGNIHERDLREDTAYNSYTRAGLPPTPIALPSREAVWAVVHPSENGALYFVATGEGDGSHHFSKTLEEHNAAVQRFLARLRGGGHT
jgi:UPF0755 protein